MYIDIKTKDVMNVARSRFSKDSTEKQLIDAIQSLGRSLGLNTVFTTFLELFATSLGANLDPVNAREREQRYEEMAAKLSPDTVTAYARICALMYRAVREHEDDPRDILGAVYHELKLNNEWNGQYFTPDDICRMMAMMAGVDVETEKDVVMINEPTCGSGAMVIGAVWAMRQKSFDFQSRTLFIAQDIDIRCVWMAYIQLCLYKIPAIVIHGNSLTLEAWSQWVTPYAVVPLMKLQEGAEKAEIEASA